MSVFSLCKGSYDGIITGGSYFQHILLLVIRLYWGYGLQVSGCSKLDEFDTASTYFASLGIPYPVIMTFLVAYIECLGGWCLILGLASRLVSIPLAIIMATALATAHQVSASMIFTDPDKFIIQAPVTFLLVTLVVFAFGPGCFSIDALFKRLMREK